MAYWSTWGPNWDATLGLGTRIDLDIYLITLRWTHNHLLISQFTLFPGVSCANRETRIWWACRTMPDWPVPISVRNNDACRNCRVCCVWGYGLRLVRNCPPAIEPCGIQTNLLGLFAKRRIEERNYLNAAYGDWCCLCRMGNMAVEFERHSIELKCACVTLIARIRLGVDFSWRLCRRKKNHKQMVNPGIEEENNRLPNAHRMMSYKQCHSRRSVASTWTIDLDYAVMSHSDW